MYAFRPFVEKKAPYMGRDSVFLLYGRVNGGYLSPADFLVSEAIHQTVRHVRPRLFCSLRFRVEVSGFGVEGSWLRVSGLGVRFWALCFMVSGFGFRVSGFGFWVLGLGYMSTKAVRLRTLCLMV